MIKFIDLFSGIGGFRIALQRIGAQCVYSAEINQHACEVYKANFFEDPYCDVTGLDEKSLPDFDILCAGFPCQAFSSAGKKQGFKDTRGTLFFDVCRIISEKKPSVVLLENVKNLVVHDYGKTFLTIKDSLNELGYNVSWKILSAKDFGLPQHRERIIIVAVKSNIEKTFNFEQVQLQSVSSLLPFLNRLSEQSAFLQPAEYTLIEKKHIKLQVKSGLIFSGYRNKNFRINGVRDNTSHLSRTHKQANRIYDAKGIHPTISSQEASGRYFVLINNQVRKLTLDECFCIMGFPSDFVKVGSKSNLYARIGNSVCVNMIEAVAWQIKKQIFE
jgi:DNA (cytosine-5)-methyltransferase 1